MPIDYQIDHAKRRVTARGSGVFTNEDVTRFQHEVWSRPDVAGYDELVDMSGVERIHLPSMDDIKNLAGLAASMDSAGARAKLAIVAPDDFMFALGRTYEAYRGLEGKSTKQVAVFRTIEPALAFLDSKTED